MYINSLLLSLTYSLHKLSSELRSEVILFAEYDIIQDNVAPKTFPPFHPTQLK